MTDVTGEHPTDRVLTMEQEFARDDQWLDWKGNTASAWEEWKYVQGTCAVEAPLVSPERETEEGGKKRRVSVSETDGVGTRDAGHNNWTLRDFWAHVNKHVREQAKKLPEPIPDSEIDQVRTPHSYSSLILLTAATDGGRGGGDTDVHGTCV
jgi:hypothetical protein